MDLWDAVGQVYRLVETLRRVTDKDQEQEVRGMAVPAMEAVFAQGKRWLPDGDPLLDSIRDVISPENVIAGEPVRAVDALFVAEQLYERLSSLHSQQTGPLVG